MTTSGMLCDILRLRYEHRAEVGVFDGGNQGDYDRAVVCRWGKAECFFVPRKGYPEHLSAVLRAADRFVHHGHVNAKESAENLLELWHREEPK